MSIKGYPSQQKELAFGEDLLKTTSEFVTVSPTDPYKRASDVAARFIFRVGAIRAALAGSTDRIVESTAHGARVGDVARFETANANQFIEAPIIKIIDANNFVMGIKLEAAVSAGDEFYLLRYATQRVDDTGAQSVVVTPSPIAFVLDGVDTEVSQDTVTPANSIPLPVINLDANGIPLDYATETTLLKIQKAALANFFTLPYDTLQVTAKTLDGPTIILSKLGGLAGVTVQTLTIAYDIDGDFESGVVS